MAVKEEELYHATEDLILRRPRRYYRAAIHTAHWQLRSLISSPVQDVVYFPSGSSIYMLNTRTNEKEIVTSVPFTPRCLTVAKGWLCCGGENGQFAVVNLEDGKSAAESLGSDPDARLPLDLNPNHRSITRDTASYQLEYQRRLQNRRFPLLASEKKVGTELVNCTTIWKPTETSSKRTYRQPVAVVANNDCSVSILDLENDADLLEKLTFPDFVNRSCMSPDGETLITICDDPFLYIHERKLKQGQKGPPAYEWVQWGRIQLAGQHESDKSNMRGSFAASFSNSGKYLAVATQNGTISAFDTEDLRRHDAEPVVFFASSRPGVDCGAVRAMEFSPGPFDLLAWTEATGKICVADVRNHFLSRQHIIFDARGEHVERVSVSERHSIPVIDPRLRNFRTENNFRTDSPSLSSFRQDNSTPDYLGLDLDRRQLSHLSRLMLDRHHTPLTAEELEVVSVSTIARRQRDEVASAQGSAWGTFVRGQQRPTVTGGATTNGEGSTSSDNRSTANYPAALREFINPDRTAAASFRSFINERNQERDRRLQQQAPRRRDSVILAQAEQAIERETLGLTRQTATRNNGVRDLENLTLSPPRLIDPPSNPWIETDPTYSPYRAPYSTSPPLDSTARLRVELEDDDRRDFAHRLRQPWRPIDEPTPLMRGIARPGNLETMGCCWSPDGRILYIGAEDGIHEFHVNIAGRKRFPSLVLR